MGRIKNEKYEEKYANEVLDEYLESRQDKKYKFERVKGQKFDSYEEKTKVNLPTIEGYSRYLKVTRKTLYNWAERFPEFKKALERIKVEQLQRLIDKGLEGTYNSTIAKLILTTNHGMRDRSDLTSGDKPIPILGGQSVSTDDSDKEDTQSK